MHAIQRQYQPNTFNHIRSCWTVVSSATKSHVLKLSIYQYTMVLNRPESTTYFINKIEAMKDKLSTSNFQINEIN